MSSLLRSPGCWLEALGAAHAGAGVVLYRRQITDVIRGGLIGSVPDEGPVATAWWFIVVAPVTWSTGRLMRAPERGEVAGAPLRTVGAVLALSGAVGAIVLPRSPFGLLTIVGLASIVTAGTLR